jgi:hypothetical protein
MADHEDIFIKILTVVGGRRECQVAENQFSDDFRP